MKKKTLKFLAKAALSLLFVAFLFFKTDWQEFSEYISAMNFMAVPIYLAILAVGVFISAYKWQILSAFKGFRYSIATHLKLYLTGAFINDFMPFFIAGDVFKSYEIAKDSKRYPQAASTVMMDRVSGLLGAMILSIVFAFLNFKVVLENPAILVLNALFLLSLGMDFLIVRARRCEWANSRVKKVLPEKISEFFSSLYSYSDNRAIVKKAVLLSILFDLAGVALLNYILFLALGIKIGILDYLSVIFVISVVSALPIALNSIGLKEWAYITFFGFFGVTSGAAVSVAVVGRFLQMILSLSALPAYIKSRKNY